MKEEMKRQILRIFAEYIESTEFKADKKLGKSEASRLRAAESDYNKDKLTWKKALLVLCDFGKVEKIKFKEIKE